MEICPKCQSSLSVDEISMGICFSCGNSIKESSHKESPKPEHNFDDVIRKQVLKNHLLNTGFTFEGYSIKRYISVVSGQVVLGTGFLSEFTASFSDFFGVQSNKFAEKLENAKNAAMEKMILKSYDCGGNAIIGVDFDYITFHGNMIGVVANGTSVIVEEEK